MPAPRHRPMFGRVAAALLALLLGAGTVAVSATPVLAVRAAPWRFTTVSVSDTVGNYGSADKIKGWVLQCPAGYTAVSGGVVGGSDLRYIKRLLEYPDAADGTYHVLVRNYGYDTTIQIAANCVWLDDVGTITTLSQTFSRNGSGRAGGIVRCPAGTTVLGAGVDWSNFSANRTIDHSTVITDGTSQGTGWYVAGYSDVSGLLGIELRCVDASLLTAEYATAADTTVTTAGNASAIGVCALGYRVLTGGAGPAGTKSPGTDQGWSLSGPMDNPRGWKAYGWQPSGVILRSLALCVPASQVAIAFPQLPASLSTDSTPTFTFTATDGTGEAVIARCYLDGVQYGCTSGTPATYGPLLDGAHHLTVTASNESGDAEVASYDWTIDATAPTVTAHAPTSSASVYGPFTMTFSEPVSGVTGSPLVVHAEATNVDVAGTVTQPTPTTASWTPKNRLIPGETYRFSFTSAITDVAGNTLIPTYFTVRAATTVESSSSVLLRYWDRDTATAASGGAYIVSRLSGSAADLTFTASAGQAVSVYGICMPDGGYASVYLDGVKVATPSFYASTTARARVYLSPALAAGTHTISVRPLGTKPSASTNTWVAIDSVSVGSTVREETALRQSFRRTVDANAYGGSVDTVVQSTATDTTPARFELTLVGTGAKVYATKSAGSGTAKIYVDGVLKATVNLSSATTVSRALVFSTTFALGKHSLRVDAGGTATSANSAVNLDRITIN